MLGDKIREARKAKNLTLNQMAEASGLTASYISQVERNLTEPSISSLRKIAAVLQLPLYAFLEDDAPQTHVIRAAQRKCLNLPDSKVVYEYVSPTTGFGEADSPNLEVIMLRLEPQNWSRENYARHPNAEECLVVLSGVLTVDCGDETYQLYDGDSIYIQGNKPHKVFNPGNTVTTAMMCITPPVH